MLLFSCRFSVSRPRGVGSWSVECDCGSSNYSTNSYWEITLFFSQANSQTTTRTTSYYITTVLPAKSDSNFMFCLQSYQGLIIDRSLVY